MKKNFLNQTSLIKYSSEIYEKEDLLDISEIHLIEKSNLTFWLNTYGLKYHTEFKKIVQNNSLDEFIIKLLTDKEHPNKVIELDNILFVTLRVLNLNKSKFDSEQMVFIVSNDFIWSIQEKKGDYFQHIRERICEKKGLVRKKKGDYLLYLII